jgi:signal transduction histidine kinase
MGETEMILILTVITAVIFIFIAGIIMFVNQYRNRMKLNEQEKAAVEKQHKLDLLSNQLKVQQQTMQFIGSEIHDSVAQKLTLATLYTRKLEYENKAPEILDKLTNIGGIISDSLEELRDLSRTLSNYDIQDSELAELLNRECNKINATGVCRVELEFDSTAQMSFIIKSALLRVIQEFIQNSIKHAECSQVKINLYQKPHGLSVTVADNGKGFDTDGPKSAGIGLNNMKRRIHLIGGEFDLQSREGHGTTLTLFIGNKNLMPE